MSLMSAYLRLKVSSVARDILDCGEYVVDINSVLKVQLLVRAAVVQLLFLGNPCK